MFTSGPVAFIIALLHLSAGGGASGIYKAEHFTSYYSLEGPAAYGLLLCSGHANPPAVKLFDEWLFKPQFPGFGPVK